MKDKKEDLKWGKQKQMGIVHTLKPIIDNLILLVDEERKRTIKKIEDVKKIIEKQKVK